MGLNDNAWKKIFEKHNILKTVEKDGHAFITAKDIKEFREPRLMAKFDHKINLPGLFSDNNLSILPVSRSEYIISNFEAYHQFETLHQNQKPMRFSLPEHLESLTADNIASETIAINCALASGILQTFLGESEIYPTVAGRMGSEEIQFNILNTKQKAPYPILVKNSQIEIDAAYEGVESLSLIEAKKDLSDDFLIRQLYYPFRLWSGKLQKKVRPVFLVYSNGIFELSEYTFADPHYYNSISLVQKMAFTLENTDIQVSDIMTLMQNEASIIPEPEISFPQADKFERVVNLCELLNEKGVLSREFVTNNYAFDVRQTNYYTDAGRYLGLIERDYLPGRVPIYKLTPLGKRIMNDRFREKQLGFANCILQHKVFRDVLQIWLRTGELPDRDRVIRIMKQSNLYQVESDSTFFRRASTIFGWLNWVVGLISDS